MNKHLAPARTSLLLETSRASQSSTTICRTGIPHMDLLRRHCNTKQLHSCKIVSREWLRKKLILLKENHYQYKKQWCHCASLLRNWLNDGQQFMWHTLLCIVLNFSIILNFSSNIENIYLWILIIFLWIYTIKTQVNSFTGI